MTRLDDDGRRSRSPTPVDGSTTATRRSPSRTPLTDNSGVAPTCNFAERPRHLIDLRPEHDHGHLHRRSSNSRTASVIVDRVDNEAPVVTITSAGRRQHPRPNATIAAQLHRDRQLRRRAELLASFRQQRGRCPSAATRSPSAAPTLRATRAPRPSTSRAWTTQRRVITITSPVDGASTTTLRSTFSFTATDDSGAAPSCDKPSGSSVALNFGSNTITVNCTDGSSNTAHRSRSLSRASTTSPPSRHDHRPAERSIDRPTLR